MNYEFIEQAGTLYIVIRKIKESSDPIIDDWKEYLLADKVFGGTKLISGFTCFLNMGTLGNAIRFQRIHFVK
jgi:hypothetical protein